MLLDRGPNSGNAGFGIHCSRLHDASYPGSVEQAGLARIRITGGHGLGNRRLHGRRPPGAGDGDGGSNSDRSARSTAGISQRPAFAVPAGLIVGGVVGGSAHGQVGGVLT